MQISFSLQMLLEKGRVTFYYCLFITALFLFFIYLPTCLYFHFFIVHSVCACVFGEKLYVRFILRYFYCKNMTSKKKNVVTKKDKATECLKSFCILLCQSIALFCYLAFHFVDSFNLFFSHSTYVEILMKNLSYSKDFACGRHVWAWQNVMCYIKY